MSAVIAEINMEFAEKIEQIKLGKPHDELELVSSRISSKEVLAVYAVLITNNGKESTEVVTTTSEKEKILRTI